MDKMRIHIIRIPARRVTVLFDVVHIRTRI